MTKLLRDYPENVMMGENHGGEEIYLRRPSWDCGWYWGFGWLGNDDYHYHLNGLERIDARVEHTHLHDQLLQHFTGGAVAEMDDRKTLWTFCEVVETIYALKKTAEVLGRGGSYYTTNPCKALVMNVDEVKRLNETVIPALIDEMYVALGVVESMFADE